MTQAHTGLREGMARVKPLEWRKYRNGDAEAITPFDFFYTAYVAGYWRSNHEGKFRQAGSSLAEAKAAAQADYERRILSCILPDPALEKSLALLTDLVEAEDQYEEDTNMKLDDPISEARDAARAFLDSYSPPPVLSSLPEKEGER